MSKTLKDILDNHFGKPGDTNINIRNLCYTVYEIACRDYNNDWFDDVTPAIEELMSDIGNDLINELKGYEALEIAKGIAALTPVKEQEKAAATEVPTVPAERVMPTSFIPPINRS